MAAKVSPRRNEYRCAVEINQNGKYCVRIQAHFGRHAWMLPVYFLASSFDRAMKKLEQSLQFLQRHEDKLWFWGVDRSDDPNLADEMLSQAGVRSDRRKEFPRKTASAAVPPDKPIPVFIVAQIRRALANVVTSERVAAAGD